MPTEMPDWALAQRRAVGNRIRELRLHRNVSQERLALDAGLARDSVYRAENATHAITVDTLVLIARALDVHPATLWDEVPDAR